MARDLEIGLVLSLIKPPFAHEINEAPPYV